MNHNVFLHILAQSLVFLSFGFQFFDTVDLEESTESAFYQVTMVISKNFF